MAAQIEVVDWRRNVAEMYAAVRASPEPEAAHRRWRRRRDVLFSTHPQSPLLPDDRLRTTGLLYFPYDPALRFSVKVEPENGPERVVSTATDGDIRMHRVAAIALPEPVNATLDVWWLGQYGGGLFVPLRDGTAGTESYGGGRYLLDTAKGADLGGDAAALVVDLNFLYHPSCRYNPAWECPLAPEGNTFDPPIYAGERL